MKPQLTLDKPAVYQIEVQGYLEDHWSDWFDRMVIVPRVDADGTSVTRLVGTVIDQAALHGLMLKLYDLGMPLLLVKCTGHEQNWESLT
ncbi:hypothetical protein ACFLXI_02785 [Chloroflexota bacterium]